MILDPYDGGCHVWGDDFVTVIRGLAQDVCEDIYRACVLATENVRGEIELQQIRDLKLDISGPIGKIYACELKRLGLIFSEIRPIARHKVLPVIYHGAISKKYITQPLDTIAKFI